MKKAGLILFALFLSQSHLSAQDSLLTQQKALEIGLKNNYSILIAKTESEMARNNNTPGNAGFLPDITGNASYNASVNDIAQQYSTSSVEVKKNSVFSSSALAGVGLGWTLFDGMKMFTTKQRLQELQDIGELNMKIQLETTISKIMLAYNNLVVQQMLYKEMNEMIVLSVERMKIAEKKFNVGSSAKQEYLQAKVDLNTRQSDLIRQRTLLRESMINLNELLAVNVDKTWNAGDSVLIAYKPDYADLKKTVMINNTSLMMAQRNLNVSNLSLKEINAQKFPKLGFTSGYNYGNTQNRAGLILLNQNLGYSYGFTLSIPLYNGHILTNQIKNARLNVLSTQLENSDLTLQVQSELLDAYETFQNDLELYNLLKQNLGSARENLEVALLSYKLGSSSSLDLITAQNSYIDVFTQMLNALYIAKAAEVALMKLNGDLVK